MMGHSVRLALKSFRSSLRIRCHIGRDEFRFLIGAEVYVMRDAPNAQSSLVSHSIRRFRFRSNTSGSTTNRGLPKDRVAISRSSTERSISSPEMLARPETRKFIPGRASRIGLRTRIPRTWAHA